MTAPGAQVSGPGALSRRTDTGGQPIRHMADPRYGEDQAFVAQQKGAPLAEAPAGPPGPYPSDLARLSGSAAGQGQPTPAAAPPREITGFGAPTARPGEPVTTGVPIGPGHGPLSPRGAQPGQLSEALAEYFAADDTGLLQDFAYNLAEMGI